MFKCTIFGYIPNALSSTIGPSLKQTTAVDLSYPQVKTMLQHKVIKHNIFQKMKKYENKMKKDEKRIIFTYYFIHRASHIILDYLQTLTPKYAHNTRKIYHFLQKKFFISLINFLKMIHSSFLLKFSDLSPKS